MKPVFPPFGDDRVRLRMLAAEDLPTTLAWRNRDDVRQWFKHSEPLAADGHAAWFARYQQCDNDFMFIVEDIANGEAVGQVAIYGVDAGAGRAEVGRFIVAPQQDGRGYMKAAIQVLVAFAVRTLKLRTLFLVVFPHNTRAIGLYRACGFTETRHRDGMMVMERVLS